MPGAPAVPPPAAILTDPPVELLLEPLSRLCRCVCVEMHLNEAAWVDVVVWSEPSPCTAARWTCCRSSQNRRGGRVGVAAPEWREAWSVAEGWRVGKMGEARARRPIASQQLCRRRTRGWGRRPLRLFPKSMQAQQLQAEEVVGRVFLSCAWGVERTVVSVRPRALMERRS